MRKSKMRELVERTADDINRLNNRLERLRGQVVVLERNAIDVDAQDNRLAALEAKVSDLGICAVEQGSMLTKLIAKQAEAADENKQLWKLAQEHEARLDDNQRRIDVAASDRNRLNNLIEDTRTRLYDVQERLDAQDAKQEEFVTRIEAVCGSTGHDWEYCGMANHRVKSRCIGCGATWERAWEELGKDEKADIKERPQ